MKMRITNANRKYVMYFALTIFIDGILFLVMDSNDFMSSVATALSALIAFFWYSLIVKRSGLLRTIYGRLLFISAAILMAGALAKLEHWWWASYCLIFGFISAGIIYLLRFLMKKNKNVLDVVKLLFFQSTWVFVWAELGHWPIASYELVKLALFYAMIFLFAMEKPPSYLNRIREEEKFSFES